MRILTFAPDGGAAFYIIKGYINAFTYLGHEICTWDGNIETWKNFKPDLYIGCSGWRQAIPKNNKCKIIIHVNPWGSKRIDKKQGWPDINEPRAAINWVIEQNPDFVFGYAQGQLLDWYWNFWIEKAGIPVIGLPTAADSTMFKYKRTPSKHMISFIGGRWPYKAMSFGKWLDPIFKQHKNHIIYGWGGWQGTGFNYKGSIEDNKVAAIFNSSKICPAISEPHTHDYGIDIPERIFKTGLCSCLTITDKINNIVEYELTQDTFPMAKTPDEMLSLVERYLSDERERINLSKEQANIIEKSHTYIKRAEKILRML